MCCFVGVVAVLLFVIMFAGCAVFCFSVCVCCPFIHSSVRSLVLFVWSFAFAGLVCCVFALVSVVLCRAVCV